MKKRFDLIIFFAIFFFGILVRLWGINKPILDWHSWRQVDTAAVTRIWVEEGGVDVLHPKYYDISSIQTGLFNPQGLRMVEFPIFNLFHYSFYGLALRIGGFGVDTTGRLTSVFFSAVSLVFLFLLVKKIYGSKTGLVVSALFAFLPFSVYYGRAVLPESAMVAFLLMALYFAKKSMPVSALSFALVLLIKPYAVFFLLPIVYLLKKRSLFSFLSFIFLAFIPLLLWRIWVNQNPVGVPFFDWAFNGDGIRFHAAWWRWLFIERIGKLILGVWGVGFLVIGLLVKKYHPLVKLLFLASFVYLGVVATANVRHDYYQVLILPAIIIATALGIIYLWESDDFGKTLKLILLPGALGLMLFSSFYQVKEYYKVNKPELTVIGKRVFELTTKKDRVVIPYNGDTAPLYQTGRFGWPAIDTGWAELIDRGATVYVGLDKTSPDSLYVKKNFKLLEEGENYIIYHLK